MLKCHVELCMYNKDYGCTSIDIEINSSGKCHQCMPISIPYETLILTPKEALDLIKAEHLKNEKELWKKRTHELDEHEAVKY